MSQEFFIDLSKEYDERYTLAKFMKYEGDNYDPLTSHVLNSIKGLKQKGQMLIEGHDYRPDVLSHLIYGDTQYWWILMVYNSYLNVDDIKNGDIVRYPDIGDLEDLYFSLTVKQEV